MPKLNKYTTQNMRLQRINADMRTQIKYLKEIIELKDKIIKAYKDGRVIDLTTTDGIEEEIDSIFNRYDEMNRNDSFLRIMNN